jgi:hypothetical protein
LLFGFPQKNLSSGILSIMTGSTNIDDNV